MPNCLVDKQEWHEDPATEYETRKALLQNSRRSFVPVRKSFVQVPRSLADTSGLRAGPLSDFVLRGDRRALEAYLTILAATSFGGDDDDDWTTTHSIMVWARAFGTTRTAEPASAANAVSKILRRLEDRQLIQRSRSGRERKIKIGLLREDGSGAAYTRPLGKDGTDLFLRLDHAFWLDGWCDRLSVPGMAMLLVALHEKEGFQLPAEHMPRWYGFSADTAERGFAELQDHKLLAKVQRRRKEPLSASGASSFYSGLMVPLHNWSPVLKQWLMFRRWMYRKYNVPADYEWHSYQWLRGAGMPDPDDSDNLINSSVGLRREIARKAMLQISSLRQFGVGIVTCETPGAVKAEAYAAMVCEVDRLLLKRDAHGIMIVDGGVDSIPDPHVRAAHRNLELTTRRVAEDGWLQPARGSQPVQMADLVAHSAYQATRKKKSHEFMWDWYGTHLHELEWECRCP